MSKSTILFARVDPALRDRVRRHATETGTTVSSTVRDAVKAHLDRLREQQKERNRQ